MKQSPIFTKTYDLMHWLIPRTLRFTKSQRGVLARRIQETMFDFHEAIVAAVHYDDPYTPLMHADTHLTALRTYVRLAKDLELLSFRQYEYVAKRVAEVGRLLGGWRKQVKKAKITTA